MTTLQPGDRVAPPVPDVVYAGITSARLAPYLGATNGDRVRAFRLYRWNVLVSGALHEGLHVLEVVMRNAMDEQLCGWNARQVNRDTGAHHSTDWLTDPSHLLKRILGSDLQTIQERAQKAVRQSANPRRPLTHGDHVAQVNFGTWRFLLPPRNPTSDPGKQRLWEDALQYAFPARNRPAERLVADVDRIHRVRNRVAHLEPFIIPGQPDLHRKVMQRILADIDPAHAAWLSGIQRITTVIAARP